MRMADILFSQGFGSRRECESLLARGLVRVRGNPVLHPSEEFEPEGLVFEVEGTAWPFVAKALVILNKPAGFECSREPRDHPSVLSLLPLPLRRRVQPVGRLDQDTTGLLLLTEDGALLHRLTSPRHHVRKTYEVGLRHQATPLMAASLMAGVRLKDDSVLVRAVACETTDENRLLLTITEGRYHQVKRMVAAVGNRVDSLHRRAIGALQLPCNLAPGQWRWVSPLDAELLRHTGDSTA